MVDWNQQEREQIRALRTIEWKALQEKILATGEQELVRLKKELDRLEAELAKPWNLSPQRTCTACRLWFVPRSAKSVRCLCRWNTQREPRSETCTVSAWLLLQASPSLGTSVGRGTAHSITALILGGCCYYCSLSSSAAAQCVPPQLLLATPPPPLYSDNKVGN
jgi:hypothetical protein